MAEESVIVEEDSENIAKNDSVAVNSNHPAVLAPGSLPAGSLIGQGDIASLGIVFSKRESRRCSDPNRAQQLWDAIGAVRAQKQIPAITRMSRYMNRHHQVNKEETQRLLDAAVDDNLIKLERKIGTKGNKSGVEEKAYRLPTNDMLPRERHDWYCFHCHSGGEVLLCAGCHRVFHESCLKAECLSAISDNPIKDDEEDIDDRQEWFCITCQITQRIPEDFSKRERKDLNHLLRLICRKMKNKIPGSILTREVPQPPSKCNIESLPLPNPLLGKCSPADFAMTVQKEEPWRANFLLKQQISIDEMDAKCASNQYRILEEFRADAQLVVHNIVIFHGAHSSLADTSRQMLRDCVSDLREILLCRDCYRYANEYREKFWFTKPCRPPHELVYAKQKGFPYWPAKVILVRDDLYEVRFFGGYHQKTLVEKQHIQPISVNVHTLQVKRTSSWNKACDELKRHQEMLEKHKDTEGFTKDSYGDPFSGGEIPAQIGRAFSSKPSSVNEEDESTDSFVIQANGTNESDRENSHITAEVQTPQREVLDEEALLRKQQQDLLLRRQQEMYSPDGKRKKRKSKKSRKEDSENFVSSSSSQELRFVNIGVQTPSKFLKKTDEKKASPDEIRDIVDKMRAEFDQEKKRAVNVATRSLERDLERLKADHATEIEEIMENHKQEISDIKKKQWCYNCEAEAIYWCCWNTAYCSIECQQVHWHKEHKKSCRRKR